MLAAERETNSSIVSELWAQVREVASARDLDLDVNLQGKPQNIAPQARSALKRVVDVGIESVRASTELHHLAVEVAYLADGLHVRFEHDGAFEVAAKAEVEAAIVSEYDRVGELGGSLSISSGRGFGLRLEVTIPYSGPTIETGATKHMDEVAHPRATAPFSSALATFIEKLTPQEEVCLSLLAAGYSNKEIAAQMHLGVGTVKYHLAQIYQKLDVQGRGRGAAVARARELGLIFD